MLLAEAIILFLKYFEYLLMLYGELTIENVHYVLCGVNVRINPFYASGENGKKAFYAWGIECNGCKIFQQKLVWNLESQQVSGVLLGFCCENLSCLATVDTCECYVLKSMKGLLVCIEYVGIVCIEYVWIECIGNHAEKGFKKEVQKVNIQKLT